MHELSVAQSLLDIVLSEASYHAVKRVKSVKVLIGELSCVSAESLSFCFEVMSRGTLAEGATLEVERVKATTKCEVCGVLWTPVDSSFSCPNCGRAGTTLFLGQELRVDSLEVE